VATLPSSGKPEQRGSNSLWTPHRATAVAIGESLLTASISHPTEGIVPSGGVDRIGRNDCFATEAVVLAPQSPPNLAWLIATAPRHRDLCDARGLPAILVASGASGSKCPEITFRPT
jgi:hypothetical protein